MSFIEKLKRKKEKRVVVVVVLKKKNKRGKLKEWNFNEKGENGEVPKLQRKDGERNGMRMEKGRRRRHVNTFRHLQEKCV